MLENFLDGPAPQSSEGVSDRPTSLPGSAKAVVHDDEFFPSKHETGGSGRHGLLGARKLLRRAVTRL